MITIDDLVIGSTASAFNFCSENNFHILLTTPKKYFFFDGDLEESKIQDCVNLYIEGKALNHNPVDSIRVEEDVLSFFNGYEKKEVKFKNLYVFDFVNIDSEHFQVIEKHLFYKVLDWAIFRTGGNHDHQHLHLGERLICDVYFYLSHRKDDNIYKDSVIVSYMSEEEINDPNLSDSLMRLKFQQVLQDYGFKGRINSRKGDRVYHLKPRFEIASREKVEVLSYKVKTKENIKYFNSYYDEVIDGRAEAVLGDAFIPFGRNNSSSETTI